MPSLTSRRSILFGRGDARTYLRPPGAVGEYDFDAACNRCNDCASNCGERIISFDKRGLPYLDFSKGGCTFCHACIDVCAAGALSAEEIWPYKINLSNACLGTTSVQCRVCQDMCDQSAIRFNLQLGGSAMPEIQSDACNGCGFCIAPCPTGALSLLKTGATQEVRKC